ncbi:MAG: tyrosine recombinase XerC [Gammaproteobacteria bacterium]|nr:tyrosine recombinase XerC [Gammaproteobacteria bacterium]
MQPIAQQWQQDFQQHLAFERRLSPHTCKAYGRDLAEMVAFADQQNLTHWSDVHSQHVRLFVMYLNRRGLAAKSIQRMLSTLRVFYDFLLRKRLLKVNPVEAVTGPKVEKKLPSVLGVDELGQLLNFPQDDPLACRDLAMMELFYSSGLRLAELAGLTLDRLDLSAAQLRVIGKGNKERELPIGRFAVEALQRWLKVRAGMVEPDQQAVFVSQQGQRLSVRSIQQRLRQRGLQQGVTGRLYPHRLRHSFASHLLESSGDIRAVQELLGHANLSTTQIYTHLDFQHLAQVYDQAHPRARKTKDKP